MTQTATLFMALNTAVCLHTTLDTTFLSHYSCDRKSDRKQHQCSCMCSEAVSRNRNRFKNSLAQSVRWYKFKYIFANVSSIRTSYVLPSYVWTLRDQKLPNKWGTFETNVSVLIFEKLLIKQFREAGAESADKEYTWP